MASSSSNSNSTSTIAVSGNGGYWQSQVALYLNADQTSDVFNVWRINHNSLISQMQKLIDTTEKIISVGVYKCPLQDWQLVQLLDCHQFVVLQTANWWYSIEKNDKFIFIQRSKHLENVRCFRINDRRNTDVVQMSADDGRRTMGDLIECLYRNNELNNGYDSVTSNCHAFAKRVFDEFAATKSHDIVLGCSPFIVINSPWQKYQG